MTFFQKNRQRYSQHRFPRRGGGYTAAQITLHTYEAPHTRTPLAGATWLLQRGDPGSYHALCGSRSARDVLQLAPWSHETWHSTPNNNWAIGISAMMYAAQWNRIPTAARNNLVNSMAYASSLAAKWLQRVHGRTVQARVLTRAQAMRKESGFVTHATMDPGRRSDPGAGFPMQQFLNEFRRLMGTSTPPPQHIPEKGQAAMATPQQIWAYSNPDVDERQVFRMLRNMTEDAWSHRGVDYVNDNPSTQAAKLARAHEYSFKAPSRVWARRGLDYVNDNPSTKNAQLARAHQYSHETRAQVRELTAMVEAMAEQLDSLKGGLADEVRKAKAEVANITARDVAAELEIDAREPDQEDED